MLSSSSNPLHSMVGVSSDDNLSPFLILNDIYNYIPYMSESKLTKIPKIFISQKNEWKDLLVSPVNQGNCGSCWSYSVAGCLSDRVNIWYRKKILEKSLSPVLSLICNIFSQLFITKDVIINNVDLQTTYSQTGCFGNNVLSAIYYTYIFGLSKEECYPYDVNNISFYRNETTNLSFFPSSSKKPKKELTTLSTFQEVPVPCSFYTQHSKIPGMHCLDYFNQNQTEYYGTPFQRFNISHFYKIPTNVDAIMKEIYANGPVVSTFTVYDDFYTFDGLEIYRHDENDKNIVGGHAVEIVGWDCSDSKNPYWWIKNSWGADYGHGGYFKFLMGKNQCHLESNVIGFFPNIFNIPVKNLESVNKLILKNKNLSEQYVSNFIDVLYVTLDTNFFLDFTENVSIESKDIIKKRKELLKKDFDNFGTFIMNAYRMSGVMTFRMTPNQFSFTSLEQFPFLETYKNFLQNKDLTPFKKNYVAAQTNTTQNYIVFLCIVGIVIIVLSFLFLFIYFK